MDKSLTLLLAAFLVVVVWTALHRILKARRYERIQRMVERFRRRIADEAEPLPSSVLALEPEPELTRAEAARERNRRLTARIKNHTTLRRRGRRARALHRLGEGW